jgi:hypothetical protein
MFLNSVKEWVPLRHILPTYFMGKYGGSLFGVWQLCVEVATKGACDC